MAVSSAHQHTYTHYLYQIKQLRLMSAIFVLGVRQIQIYVVEIDSVIDQKSPEAELRPKRLNKVTNKN